MNTFSAMMEHSLCYEEDEDLHPKFLKMWATHYAYQNDPTECILFFNELRKEVYKKIIDSTEEQKKLTDAPSPFDNIYLISFSEQEDDLTMWRGYGQDGDGISLGFDFSQLPNDQLMRLIAPDDLKNYNAKNESEGHVLLRSEAPQPCLYVNPNSFSIGDQALKRTLKNLEEEKTDFKDVVQNIINAEYAPLFKHYKYEAEREWRIIRRGDMPVYQLSSNIFIPHIEIKIAIACLKKIIVGPCQSSEEAVRNIKMYMLSKGLDISDIDVELSKIPYRNRL